MKKLKKGEILRKNPHTDAKVVEDFERLAAKLKKLGVEPKSNYTLSPPLGDAVVTSPATSQSSTKK